MKKHISVLGLFARSTLLPILGILLLMAGVEVLCFHLELTEALTAYRAGVGTTFPQLERLLASASTYALFRPGLILISALLCACGCQGRTRSSYTWRRLSVTEPTVFVWQAVYHTLVFLLAMLTQTLVAYGLCCYYVAAAPAEVLGNQTLFLAFWRSEFLHALLPLSDIALWIRNVLLILALGLSTAIFPFKQRRGQFSGSAIAVLVYATVGFDCGIGDFGQVVMVAAILAMVAVEVAVALLHADEEEAGKDNEQETEVSDRA